MVKDGIVLGKRYEVLSKIGAGGMADVYKGKDTMLNRFVAIKVLKKEYREDENFVRKFHSEAQAAAGLLNPNIVNVYDVGEDRGLYYMVMELVEGITLKEYIEKKGRLSHKEVISIAIQMCNGIGAAHAAGIVHRDIKPQNVIISRDGKVKVTDFGIAKAVTSTTISSNAMGSVHYTSPEQARGGYSDARSDIYSIGITLYEMATGRVPFDGESTVEVAMKHLQQEITPPSEYAPDIPYSLEQIILKCTQKNSERRYASTTELTKDLKRSMMDPDGDFVVIPPLRNADTVIITDEELDDIRNSYDEYDDDYGDDSYNDEYDDDDDDEYDDYDDGKGSDEVNPRMNKVMKILMIVVAIIIAFILIFTVGKAAGIFKSFGSGTKIEDSSDKDTVKVPNIVGYTEEAATKMLKEKGLEIKVDAREDSEKYEAGTVSEQKTKAGTKVKKHSTVHVIVSSALVGKEIIVPDVSGKSEDDAWDELNKAGFKNIESDFQYDDNVAEGDVISTTPAANSKATKDTEIKMIVSKGAEKKTVPDVRGKSEAEARSEIQAAGLTIGSTSTQHDDSVAKGSVISQSVTPGKKVSAGTAINLVLSGGTDKVNIQSFVGQDEEELLSWASQNGLNASKQRDEYSSNYEEGTVISMSPSSGSVAKGSTITYVLSRGPKPSDNNSGDNIGNEGKQQ